MQADRRHDDIDRMTTYPLHRTVEPTTARELRMLTTLLAGCDPCGYVEDGGSPTLYAGMALDSLRRLYRGTDPIDMLNVFPGGASAAKAAQFTRVAVDWFDTARSVRDSSLRAAAQAFAV